MADKKDPSTDSSPEIKKEGTKQEGLKRKTLLRRMNDRIVQGALRLGLKTFYGFDVKGVEHFKGIKNEPTLIVANHVSFIDGLLLGAALPVEASYAIDTDIYNNMRKNPLMRFLMSRLDLHPVNTANPQAIRDLSRLAKSGKPVMIFPEGRMTTSGTLMQVYDGAGAVADSAKAKIVPVYLKGLNFLPNSLKRLRGYPSKLFPKLSVTIGKPTTLDMPEGLSGKARRKLRKAKMEKIMQDLPVEAADKDLSLMDALHDSAKNFGPKYAILDDAEEWNKPLNYRDVMTGAYALGGALAKDTVKGENVGFLLPNSKAAAVTFWGMQAYGRVPTMLNAKAEMTDMMSYTQTASLKTIVTSRRFVELAKMEDKIEELAKTCKIVYLEDTKKKIGTGAKIKAALRARGLLPRPKDRAKANDPAVIIFTSGSEGPPKGVVLSSQNILSNVAQAHAVAPFTPSDKLFNAMPVFHSFGLSGGMIMPMLEGMRSLQYPSPLDGKNIPKIVYMYDATIMFGTDTFLSLYARSATDQDFTNLRKGMVFAGAERLSDNTYNAYADRFGVTPYQGYGLSEAAPIVAINAPGAHKRGTVGRFLPGIETRLEPVDDIPGSAKLSIRGPNIMLGYLKHDNPGVIQPPPDGWHDTGDIISMSDDGYVSLTGRAKRFAKIGGEMVSLDAVEKIAAAASAKQDSDHATVLKQDADKGDSIVLFTTDADLKRDQLGKAAQATGRAILGLPKNDNIIFVEDIPRLPTGKTDYVTLKKRLLADFTEAATPKSTAAAAQPAAEKPAAPQSPGTPKP